MEVVNKMYKLSELPNVYCLSVNVKDVCPKTTTGEKLSWFSKKY